MPRTEHVADIVRTAFVEGFGCETKSKELSFFNRKNKDHEP